MQYMMAYYQHQVSVVSSENKERRRLRRRMKGSRHGYAGDADDLPASCSGGGEESDTSSDPPRNTSGLTSFYSHIEPRRRRRRRRNETHHPRTSSFVAHPGIDFSMVSLLSSKELDRRFSGLYNHDESSSTRSSSAASRSSSSSDSTQGQGEIIKNEKKQGTLARPLAVVDYGSIDLDMSGSLLDSIYKIDGKGRSKDLRFSSLNGEYSNKAEVQAVKRRGSYSPEGPPRLKKQKTSQAAPAVDNRSPTTLEDAISFSPYARVLFCAQSPYTIVHTNAAYGTLMRRIVGEPFASSERCEAESPEEHITRIVAGHIEALQLENDGSTVRVFPVLSSDESFSQLCSHKKCHSQLKSPTSCNGEGENPSSRFPQYLSHYLLQIEPCAQLGIAR